MFKVGSFYWWNALKDDAFIYLGEIPNDEPDLYAGDYFDLVYLPFQAIYKTYAHKQLWEVMNRFKGERELLIWEPD